MTIGAFGRLTRLKLIVQALIGERFVRCALLHELIDLAAEVPGFEMVLTEAMLLLRAVDQGVDAPRFDRQVRSIVARLADMEAGSSDGPAPTAVQVHYGADRPDEHASTSP
jgi:hypothetical protein